MGSSSCRLGSGSGHPRTREVSAPQQGEAVWGPEQSWEGGRLMGFPAACSRVCGCGLLRASRKTCHPAKHRFSGMGLDGRCPSCGQGGKPSTRSLHPLRSISAPVMEWKGRLLLQRNASASGPAEIESKGERLPDGFASKINQEPGAVHFIISAPAGSQVCMCIILCFNLNFC